MVAADDEPLSTYQWSSYPAYLKKIRPPWLRVDRVMGEWAIPGDTAAGRKRMEQLMEARHFEADGRQYQDLRRGWVMGSDEFRKELLAQTGQWLGPNHYGTVRRETAEVAARRMIAERLRKERLTPEKLPLLSASHPIKVQLALQLRQQTTMGLKWIAQELAIGSWKYLSNLLSREQPTSAQGELSL